MSKFRSCQSCTSLKYTDVVHWRSVQYTVSVYILLYIVLLTIHCAVAQNVGMCEHSGGEADSKHEAWSLLFVLSCLAQEIPNWNALFSFRTYCDEETAGSVKVINPSWSRLVPGSSYNTRSEDSQREVRGVLGNVNLFKYIQKIT